MQCILSVGETCWSTNISISSFIFLSQFILLSSTRMNCLSCIFSLGSLYFTLQSLSFDTNPFTFTGLLYTKTSTRMEMNKPIKPQFIHSISSDCTVTANHQVSLLPCRMKSKCSLLLKPRAQSNYLHIHRFQKHV